MSGVQLPPAADLQRLHAQARDWVRVLRLPFRQQRWHGQAGEFTGTGVGSSLDFQDHRVYSPGDDPRQINWQAYARTGTYTMKLYREEVRPLVDLVLDVSASMFAYPAKQQRVLELLAFAAEASLSTGASVRSYLVRGKERLVVETAALLEGRWPALAESLPATDEPPALNRIPFRPGAMRLLISDLLFPADPAVFLAPLAQAGGRGLLFSPYSAEESAPEWEGNYEFEDAETTLLHEQRIEPDILQRYLAAYHRHFSLYKTAAARLGIAFARVESGGELLSALRGEALAAGAVETA